MDLLAASMRRWRGYSEDDSCSFTLLMSLGWMKSNKLCPVSSNCEPKRHTTTYYSTFYHLCITWLSLFMYYKSSVSFPALLLPRSSYTDLIVPNSTCSKCIRRITELLQHVFSRGLLVSPKITRAALQTWCQITLEAFPLHPS